METKVFQVEYKNSAFNTKLFPEKAVTVTHKNHIAMSENADQKTDADVVLKISSSK